MEDLNSDGPGDQEGGNVDAGGAVGPWQIPLLIETSSIARSPV